MLMVLSIKTTQGLPLKNLRNSHERSQKGYLQHYVEWCGSICQSYIYLHVWSKRMIQILTGQFLRTLNLKIPTSNS